MVMATFSPQYVGREFVRQYYTMLHKDPMQLHRFYMKHSLFTHGSCQNGRSDEPVIGQEAIHSKICQLNFRDCYAKIKSVDSHPTINGGVVVQVTGELSNRSLPMRRFMQTFVLAPQAPKKYYVYNDIFRYQDEMFEETENEETGEGTGGEYESEGEEAIVPEPLPDNTLDDELSTEFERMDEPTSTFSELEDSQASLVNGGMGVTEDGEMEEEEEVDTENESSELEEVVVETPQEQKAPVIQEQFEFNEEPEEEAEDSQPVFEEEETEPETLPEDESLPELLDMSPEAPPLEPEGPPKPVTWAAMAKKNTPTSPPQPAATAPRIVAKQPPPPAPQPAALPPRPQRRREEFVKRDVGEGRRRKFSGPPPDSHQIFIGNLPNNISEADVRSLFQEYGNIVEVRLNAKNFGFVAFDAPEPAEKILNRSKPIMFGKQTINIEEKRSSGSAGRGGPRRDRDFGGRMRNDSGSRGGPGRSGPPGGGRNGQRGGGPSGPQKSKGDDVRNSDRGPRNRDRGGPGGKR